MTLVTGQLNKSNGQPLTGVVVTAKSSTTVHNHAGTEVPQVEVTTTTNSAGEWQLSLAPTTEANFPAGTYYTIACTAASLSVPVYVPDVNRPLKLSQLPAAQGVGTFTGTVTGTATPSKLVVPVAAAAPGSPTQGQVYYDTVLKKLGVYTGTEWEYAELSP